MYSFTADYLNFAPVDRWDETRGEYVQYGQIAFSSDPDRTARGFLCLTREWVVEGRVERYEGPVGIAVEDGYGADDGIVGVELGRSHLRLTLDETAAAGVEDDVVLVEFDFDDAEFDRLRRELREMFADLLTVRDV